MKDKKTKALSGHGNLTVSNVNSNVSECITLTYSIFNVKTLKQAAEIKAELDDLHNEDESSCSIEIENYDSDTESLHMKYKLKACGSEEMARKVKKEFDTYIKKKGGQTTLTEEFEKQAKAAV